MRTIEVSIRDSYSGDLVSYAIPGEAVVAFDDEQRKYNFFIRLPDPYRVILQSIWQEVDRK